MLTSKERAALRAQANSLEPLFQVGKGGISDALIAQTEDALNARELIKLKVLVESCPETPRQVADKISEITGADVVQVIGGCMIFYRESPELRKKLKEKEDRKKELAKKAKQKAAEERKKNRKYPGFAAAKGTKRT